MDYCSVTGAGGEWNGTGPYNGVIVRNYRGDQSSGAPLTGFCRMVMVTDGTSNTMMIAEKRLDPTRYRVGTDFDDTGWAVGWDNDNTCITSYAFGPDVSTASQHQLGSAHPAGMMAAFADGSIRMIRYGISTTTLNNLGDRQDGQVIDASGL